MKERACVTFTEEGEEWRRCSEACWRRGKARDEGLALGNFYLFFFLRVLMMVLTENKNPWNDSLLYLFYFAGLLSWMVALIALNFIAQWCFLLRARGLPLTILFSFETLMLCTPLLSSSDFVPELLLLTCLTLYDCDLFPPWWTYSSEGLVLVAYDSCMLASEWFVRFRTFAALVLPWMAFWDASSVCSFLPNDESKILKDLGLVLIQVR